MNISFFIKISKVLIVFVLAISGSVGIAHARSESPDDSPPDRGADPEYQVIISEGDLLVGVGLVTSILNLAVDSDGNTVIEVDTDNLDLDIDGAVVRNGDLLLQEGQALPLPAGALLDAFDSLTINTSLHSAWNFALDGTSGVTDDAGLYFETNLLVQEGSASSAPQFAPNNIVQGFFECKLNESDHILVITSVYDPWVASYIDMAVILMTVDAGGNLASETVVLREGDIMPGQVWPIQTIGIRAQEFAFNELDQFMFTADEDGALSSDRAVYVDNTLVAREGSPSPVAARNWLSLAGVEVDLNNLGDWVLHGELEGDAASDYLIEKSGAKLVQEGDSLPGMNGYQHTRFGTGPVFISDSDNVLWFGDWNDPDTTRDTGLFLNDQLIVQEGVTTVDGIVIENLRGVEKGYAMSRDGNYVLFEADLADGNNVAVLLHIGPWTYLGHGLAGTGGKTPMLRGKGSLAGNSVVNIELTNAKPNTTTALVIGFSEISAPFRGGTFVPFPDFLFLALPVDASGELTISFQVPVGIPPGIPIWFQYWPKDPASPAGFSASNAVKGTTP